MPERPEVKNTKVPKIGADWLFPIEYAPLFWGIGSSQRGSLLEIGRVLGENRA